MMKDGDSRHGPCPDCGAPATFYYSEYRGDEWHACERCIDERVRQKKRFERDFQDRFPMLSLRLMRTFWRNMRTGDGMTWLLSASDDDLSDMTMIGKKMLADFRAVWPVPMADIGTTDPWRDHAEMVAGVR